MTRPDDEVTSSESMTYVQPQYVLAPYVPTPPDVVDRMLELAAVTREDVIYDLGCGDGRIVIAAAEKYGARGVGVDVEPYWISQSRATAKERGVDHLANFLLHDALTVDLKDATVVTLYLVAWSTGKMQDVIKRQVKAGTRIVSLSFEMDGWAPNKTEEFVDEEGTHRRLHLWVV